MPCNPHGYWAVGKMLLGKKTLTIVIFALLAMTQTEKYRRIKHATYS